jgi:tetratricopeptide (TPR) repeat protein
MKKETVILAVVIAFVVGFITGATVAILKGRGGTATPRIAQKPQGPPPEASGAALPGPSPAEVAGKVQALKDILQKDPKNLGAWVELGNLYFDSGQPREAIEAYSKYLAVKPDNADVRTDLGIMYRRVGDPDRALKEFREAAQADPKHANSRYNIGVVLLHDKQDIKGAIKAWEEYVKVEPQSERAKRVQEQMDKLKQMVK